ncbi:MAG: hypothetical protein ACI8W7_003229, partial [Gammaproteobacteria bacterium]
RQQPGSGCDIDTGPDDDVVSFHHVVQTSLLSACFITERS